MEASTLTTAIGYITTAVGDVATMVTSNAYMMIGIAGALVASGVGIFKSLTNQRRGRRR